LRLQVKKGRGRPKKPTGEGIQVRIDSDLVRKAKFLAALENMEPAAYISHLLRPAVEQAFKKAGREFIEDAQPEE